MKAEYGGDNRGREIILTGAIVAAHLCISVPLAIALSIWIDEAYSLAASTGDLAFVLRQSRDVEMQPPVYFVLLWAWRLIDASIPFARMLSVLIAAAALGATHLAARRWLPGIAPAWTVAPLAFNTYTIYAATEIRTYSLVLLWTALLLIFFHDAYMSEKPRRSARWAHAATALAALATYYYLGFILAACAVALFTERRWRTLRTYVLWMIAVGVLFLPLFLQTSGHIESARIDALPMPSLIRSVEFVVASFAVFPFALFALSSTLRLTVLAILLPTAAVTVWKHRGRTTPETRAMWVITSVVAVFYVLVVRFVLGEEIRPRHMMVALVPAIFSIVCVAALFTRNRRYALAVWAAAAIGLSSVASYQQFKPLAKGGDFKRVARYLEANEKPGQSIAIVVAHAEAPLSHYYRGKSALVAIPERDRLTGFLPEKWRLQSKDQVRAKLDPALSVDGEIWIFTDFLPGATYRALGTDLNFQYLEAVLVTDYEIVSRQDFYAASVRLVRKRAGPGTPVASLGPPAGGIR